MSGENEDKKRKEKEAEEAAIVLRAVSKEVPALIKAIISSVFSEEAGRDRGKAVVAFYKELKESGMPEETIIKMTEQYISTLSSALTNLLQNQKSS